MGKLKYLYSCKHSQVRMYGIAIELMYVCCQCGLIMSAKEYKNMLATNALEDALEEAPSEQP